MTHFLKWADSGADRGSGHKIVIGYLQVGWERHKNIQTCTNGRHGPISEMILDAERGLWWGYSTC